MNPTMFRALSPPLIAMMLACAGCGQSVDSQDSAQPQEPAEIPAAGPAAAAEEPAPPPFRELTGAIADQEIYDRFGILQDTRDAAKEYYANQRWRLRGRVALISGTSIVITSPDFDNLWIRMRSDDGTVPVQTGSEYEFEGTIEEFVRGGTRMLNDGIVIEEPEPPSGS